MGWILLMLLIVDWIVMFIKLSKAVKQYRILEKGEEAQAAFKYIKQFLLYMCIGIVICILILVYSYFRKNF